MAVKNLLRTHLVDLGYAAKVRPCLVLSVPPEPQDRAVVSLIPHTTSVQGTRFEVSVPKRFLKAGVFDAQGLVTVARARLIRRLGKVQPGELVLVEEARSSRERHRPERRWRKVKPPGS